MQALEYALMFMTDVLSKDLKAPGCTTHSHSRRFFGAGIGVRPDGRYRCSGSKDQKASARQVAYQICCDFLSLQMIFTHLQIGLFELPCRPEIAVSLDLKKLCWWTFRFAPSLSSTSNSTEESRSAWWFVWLI